MVEQGPDRDGRIRELAYGIWEQEGRPQGQAERHWLTAERAIEQMERAEVEITMNADGVPENERPFAGRGGGVAEEVKHSSAEPHPGHARSPLS